MDAANVANVLDPDEVEQFEEQEPEESAPEDLLEPGVRERNTHYDENPTDRHEMIGKERAFVPQPTPGERRGLGCCSTCCAAGSDADHRAVSVPPRLVPKYIEGGVERAVGIEPRSEKAVERPTSNWT